MTALRRVWCFVGLLAIVCTLGCHSGEWGPLLTEQAHVEAKVYMPSGHGSGTGFSTRGSVSFVQVDIPARYGVAFRCQHGSFAIEGEQGSRAYDAWKHVEQGQEVTIEYREYIETVKGGNGDPGTHIVTDMRFERVR